MDPEDADPAPEARPPLLEDLVPLCRNLNREGARYVVIGGMAVIQAGFGRATNDVDLLIDASPVTDVVELEGVPIPFANARLLWKTNDTVRDKDKVDRAFLARLLAERGEPVE